jgi:hypothetical protein
MNLEILALLSFLEFGFSTEEMQTWLSSSHNRCWQESKGNKGTHASIMRAVLSP